MSGQQIWYADDATTCGDLKELQCWWDKLTSADLGYGYFSNPSKTCIVVKTECMMQQFLLFKELVSITSDGKCHLGAALSSPSFVASFVDKQLDQRVAAAVRGVYVAFTLGFIGKWNFLFLILNHSYLL